MRHSVALFALAAVISGSLALAAPPKAGKKPTKPAKTAAHKIVDVWHCPMTGDAITDKTDKGVVYGSYRAHFCCGMCAPSFNKLSAKEQQTKLAAMHKKDAAPAKKS
ncbi:MAG TPA: hypothetical protein VKT32_09465 [Chthonomonadaceae bacterium]|nr:hypothetical protein [Chthonomonadaceae bacterium]